jgi:regulator of sigma E protease
MITSVIAFILVLGILIFIHELGHFMVAKLSGVGVEKFSLGFGPRILGITRGETEYRISLLPFGGYVKMLGESAEEKVPEEDKLRSFTHKPLSKRAAIVAAGSAMNIVLALVLFPLIYMIGVNVPAYLERVPEIGYVTPDKAAFEAGIKKGDIIESVDGRGVKSWEEFVITTAIDPEKELRFGLRRGDSTFETTFEKGEPIGIYPPMSPTIGGVVKGGAAEEAGLKPGDKILAIDGREIDHWAVLQDIVHEGGEEREFLIEREDGTYYHVNITPVSDKEAGGYLIGVTYHEEIVFKRYGFFGAVKQGMVRAAGLTVLLFRTLKGLFLGEYSIKTLGGPILIAQVAGQAAQTGLTALLTIVAFLSLQLGIINLFPIPVLDGGHLMFYAIELVRGRPISEKIVGVAQQVGVAMLIALMLLVTWNDILRVFGWG